MATSTIRRNLIIITISAFLLYAFHLEPWGHSGHFMIYSALFAFSLAFAIKYQTDKHFAIRHSPSKKLSRFCGRLAWIPVPKFLRKPIYTLWAKMKHANLEEMQEKLEDFPNFHYFFTRKIHPRPIDPHPLSVASSNDGKVEHITELTHDENIDVKGIKYRVGELFTGVPKFKFDEESINQVKRHPENKLYLINLFLAPGNYHRYHSPADFLIRGRNHTAGFVRPVMLKYELRRSDIYEENERVILVGEWEKGFMAVNLIAAGPEVGSMQLHFDPQLRTNLETKEPFPLWEVKEFPNGQAIDASEDQAISLLNSKSPGIEYMKGEELGMFNYGSSIVLLFEASADFQWLVKPGDTIKYGQAIGISS